MTDIPQLFVIRYLRNSSNVDTRTQETKKWKPSLAQDLVNEYDPAGQFVARYKGADDISQVGSSSLKIFALQSGALYDACIVCHE